MRLEENPVAGIFLFPSVSATNKTRWFANTESLPGPFSYYKRQTSAHKMGCRAKRFLPKYQEIDTTYACRRAGLLNESLDEEEQAFLTPLMSL
jgi:hypothetical protein